MWSDALDISSLLPSYPLMCLASPMTNILISALKYTPQYVTGVQWVPDRGAAHQATLPTKPRGP